MSKEEVLETHADMFKNLEEYVLIRNADDYTPEFRVFHKTNSGFELVENSSDELTDVMLELGVQVVTSQEEITLSDYKAYTVVWNEEKQDWEKVLEEDFIRMLEERNKSRK